MLWGDAHGVEAAHTQAGVLGASVPHLPGGSWHPARTGGASSALETTSVPPRPSVSGVSAKEEASWMSPQPGEACVSLLSGVARVSLLSGAVIVIQFLESVFLNYFNQR